MTSRFVEKILQMPLVIYIMNSIIVSLIDTIIVWILYRQAGVFLVIANTIGVVTGFVIHYLLSSKSVFGTEFGYKGFIIYFGTFIFGLILADSLIYAGEHYLFLSLERNISFLFSKGISILIPFFILYFIRRFLFQQITNRNNADLTA